MRGVEEECGQLFGQQPPISLFCERARDAAFASKWTPTSYSILIIILFKSGSYKAMKDNSSEC